ncbi:MAG: NAD(P)/FAD-dependent oxidoreductase [Verrucomicrobia bacterium]|nr:NAD(P)/FAD-dependent oxidoreductase [Verrucomicrobiota bacterium]
MDYEVAVIGSGSAGKEAALLAAKQGRSVVVIEKETLGGTCFHRGCFAIRTLRACADAFHNRLFANRYGIDLDRTRIRSSGWAEVRRRVSSKLADQLNQQFQKASVSVRFGKATFLDGRNLRLFDVYGRWTNLSAEHVLVATGSRPRFFAPAETKLLNSDQLLGITELPGHLLIIGAGYVGCEFASIFRAFGSIVTLVEKQSRLLPDWDEGASAHLLQSLREAGVNVILGVEVNVEQVSRNPGTPLQVEVGELTIKPDLLLVATGRLPNVEELGLEALDIKTTPFIEVGQNMRTDRTNIYAIGDVNGLTMLDSTALAQAQTAVDAIGGKQTYFASAWTPRCVYTSPQMAAVGWMEQEAFDAGLDVLVGWETTELLTDDELKVLDPYPTRIKVVLEARTKKILGCLAIGDQAIGVVDLCSMLIRSDIPSEHLIRCRFVHPSPAEALQRCVNSVAAS